MSMFNKIVASVKVDLKNSLIYVGNFSLTYMCCIVAMIIQMVFWKAVYVAGTEEQFSNMNIHTTVIGGYRLSEMLVYVMFIYLMSSCNSSVEIKGQIKNDIMSGGINIHLMRPIQYLLYRWCLTISKQTFTIILSIIMALIYIKILNVHIEMDMSMMIAIVVFVLFALGISFLFSMIIGLLSFWLFETRSVSVIFSAIAQFLSGGILPIDFFGEGAARIVQYSPFTYMAYFPAQIILKRVDVSGIFRGAIICLFWICFLVIIASALWRRGIRKYSAFGG